ncbi:MAG TPA: ATP-binding protein [Vicinamibacterales bacterium]|nr:ATP-binding protein [Vicinamibacterales bacterium]
MNTVGPPADGARRWWRSHSVRVRLAFWYVGAMLVVIGVYVAAVYVFVSRNASENLNQQLRQDFTWVYASLYQDEEGMYMLTEPERIDPDFPLPWVQVWRGDRSRVVYRNGEAQRTSVPESRSVVGEGIVTLTAEDGERMRIMTQRGALKGPFAESRVVIQIGRSESSMDAQLRDLALILVLGLPIAVAVAGVGGYVLARRALAPIERMTSHARTITAERLNDRLPVDNPDDEMGRLAAVFNQTLGRLEQSFEQMRRFTADVSHQLRTPLTAIRSVGEVGLRAGRRDEASYRAIIGSMLEETDRLSVLVDRLLSLSRAETHQATLTPDSVSLVELAEDVVGHLGVLAEEKGQSLSVDATGRPTAVIDRVVLRQALINLVDNAIKFTPSGGQVSVRVTSDDGTAVVDVTDTGPGIPSEARERIFDRFFRGDELAASGTGLGLSIAKGAVEANGGQLTLERSDAQGTTFRIRLSKA